MGSLADALEGVSDGSVVFVGGFGEVGVPNDLCRALVEQGATDLTVVANNAGAGDDGVAALLKAGRVRRVICSYPRSAGSVWFEKRYDSGELELEVVPQGTLTERIRAAGAGIGAFFTPTAAETDLAEGKEVRLIGGRPQILEMALHADLSLIRARQADRWGNLTYRDSARNYNPTMAMAAKLTVAEVEEVVPLGALNPEHVITPGCFVDRFVLSTERRSA